MNYPEISSFQNPKIKETLRLWERRVRNESQLFLIEGYRELKRATDAKWKLETLFICPPLFLGSNELQLIAQIEKQGARITQLGEALFKKLSYRDRPDGLLGIAPQVHKNLSDLEAILKNKNNHLLVVAESIEKPGNLGTILRSSDAVAVDAVIVADSCTDIFNPNVVRASVGTLFTVPVIEAESEECLRWLKEKKIQILAATPSASLEFTQANMNKPLAIVVGTEQLGLSDKWMDKADLQVRIPMNGVADSLNVATATTLLLYEALRQRL